MTLPTTIATPQGFGISTAERLPIPKRSAMSQAQRDAADARTNAVARTRCTTYRMTVQSIARQVYPLPVPLQPRPG